MPEGVNLGITIKRRRGRPDHVPTQEYRHTVNVLRSTGTPEETIARLLRLDRKTLKKHYRQELKEGHETIVAAIGSVIVNAALDGNIGAAFGFLARQGGEQWRKVEGRLHGGLPGAEPIEVNARARVVILPDNGRPSLTEAEIAAERAAAREEV
jgi:hypothetical protein